MQINCPECGCLNHVEQRSIVECYVLEYRCKCGFYLMHTDYNLVEAFKGFSDEIAGRINYVARVRAVEDSCKL